MSGKMWEVDPETKSKLLDIQKTNDNNKCVDCGAPSPQWVRLFLFLPSLHGQIASPAMTERDPLRAVRQTC
jgi:hypothetical protein